MCRFFFLRLTTAAAVPCHLQPGGKHQPHEPTTTTATYRTLLTVTSQRRGEQRFHGDCSVCSTTTTAGILAHCCCLPFSEPFFPLFCVFRSSKQTGTFSSGSGGRGFPPHAYIDHARQSTHTVGANHLRSVAGSLTSLVAVVLYTVPGTRYSTVQYTHSQ